MKKLSNSKLAAALLVFCGLISTSCGRKLSSSPSIRRFEKYAYVSVSGLFTNLLLVSDPLWRLEGNQRNSGYYIAWGRETNILYSSDARIQTKTILNLVYEINAIYNDIRNSTLNYQGIELCHGQKCLKFSSKDGFVVYLSGKDHSLVRTECNRIYYDYFPLNLSIMEWGIMCSDTNAFLSIHETAWGREFQNLAKDDLPLRNLRVPHH